MTKTTNSNSRFALLDSAVATPGCCHFCGSIGGDGRKFVDFGITVEFVGVIYGCTNCMTECLSVLGIISSEEFEKNQEMTKELESKVKGLEDECDRLRTIANAVGVLRDSTSWAPSSDVQTSKSNVAESFGYVKPDVEDEPGPSESVDVGRREDVSDPESIDTIEF